MRSRAATFGLLTLGEPGPYTDAVDAFLRSIGVP
jgi:hypothetical protein